MRHQHANLRERLLTTVGDVLRERGIDGLSLREVARRAGVSPGAPAYHFGTFSGMLTAFAARGFDRLTRAVIDEVEGSGARGGEHGRRPGHRPEVPGSDGRRDDRGGRDLQRHVTHPRRGAPHHWTTPGRRPRRRVHSVPDVRTKLELVPIPVSDPDAARDFPTPTARERT